MRICRLALLLAFGLVGTGCAGPSAKLPQLPADQVAAEKRKQEITQLRDYYAQLRRLETVAFRIRTANKADCNEWVSPQIGLKAATPRSLPRRFQSFSAEALNLRWVRATVISVVTGSPADKAGIKPGDELISFNGEPVPTAGTTRWMHRFLNLNGKRPLQVMFRRDDKTNLLVTVKPAAACAIPIVLEINPEPGAHTDYSKIVVQSGILRLAQTDSELAIVVGHELAHVNMGHYEKRMQNYIVGTISGALVDGGFMFGGVGTGGAFTKAFGAAGARAFSVSFEREADYVGAYYAARAGYDISGAENIWRAMGLENPASIQISTTHPTTPERYVFIKKTIAEIEAKRRRHLPLVPDLKFAEVRPEPGENENER